MEEYMINAIHPSNGVHVSYKKWKIHKYLAGLLVERRYSPTPPHSYRGRLRKLNGSGSALFQEHGNGR